jgi:hypothetical protein
MAQILDFLHVNEIFCKYPQKNPVVSGLDFMGHLALVNTFQSNN